MAYELRNNTGNLFATKVKKHPKAPDYQGEMLVDISTLEVIDGKAKIRLAGWKQTSAKGTTYLSLNIDTWKPDNAKQNTASTQQTDTSEGLDDDIPF
jgi:uncharacterized protein (DUF736 family)